MLISREDLARKVGSVYKLCNMAALRASELNVGMKPLLDTPVKEKVTTTALREIDQEKVKLKKQEEK